MQLHENNSHSHRKNQTKYRKSSIFLLVLITLFLTSFSATAFILVKTNQLTFAGGSIKDLRQEVQELKTELARKNSEIEELKLQIANSDVGESSFTGSIKSSHETASPKKQTESPKPSATPSSDAALSATPTPNLEKKPEATLEPEATAAPSSTPKPTQSPVETPKPTAQSKEEPNSDKSHLEITE